MNIYKNLLLDWLGKRQTGHNFRQRRHIEEMPAGSTVAILHTNDKIGDAIVRSAFLLGLRRSPLKLKQVVITTPRFYDYWQDCIGVDEVQLVLNRKVDGALKTVTSLAPFLIKHRRKSDVLVNFDQYCRVGEFFKASFLKSQITVGFSKEMFALFNYSIPNNIDGTNLRTPAERTRDLLALFGVRTDRTVYPVHIPVGRSDLVLESLDRPRVLVNTYSNSEHRSFSVGTLRSLSRAVLEQMPNAQVYVNLPARSSAYDGWNSEEDERLTRVMPLRSQNELFDFVNQMDAVVTPDTGIAHIAAGLGKPLFVVFSNDYFFSQSWRPMSDPLAFVSSRTDKTVNDLDWNEVRQGLAQTLSCVESPFEREFVNA